MAADERPARTQFRVSRVASRVAGLVTRMGNKRDAKREIRERATAAGAVVPDTPGAVVPGAVVTDDDARACNGTGVALCDGCATADAGLCNMVPATEPVAVPEPVAVTADTLRVALTDERTMLAFVNRDGVPATFAVARVHVGIAYAFAVNPVNGTVNGPDGTSERVRLARAYAATLATIPGFDVAHKPNVTGITGRPIGCTQCDVWVASTMLPTAPASGAVTAMWRALIPASHCDFIARWDYGDSTNTKFRHASHNGSPCVNGACELFARHVDTRRNAAAVRIVTR